MDKAESNQSKWFLAAAFLAVAVLAMPSVASAQFVIVNDPLDPNDPNDTTHGTKAWSATADAPSFATNFAFGAPGGGPTIPNAFSTITDSRGSATGDASLGGPNSEPLLKAFGSGNTLKLGSGDAFGLQTYENTSSTATIFTLDATLTGSLQTNSASAFDGIRANVVAFTELPPCEEDPNDPNYDPNCVGGTLFLSHLPTLIAEVGAVPYPDITSPTSDPNDPNYVSALLNFNILADDPSINVNQSTMFLVQPGERIGVWAFMNASAVGGTADALSTLDIVLTQETSVIPMPGAAGLGAAAVLALNVRRRRRR